MNEDKKIYSYLASRQDMYRKKSIKKLFSVIPKLKKGEAITVFSTRSSIEWVKKKTNRTTLKVRSVDKQFYKANWNDWRAYRISCN